MDHHATTPVDPRVLEKMLPYFTEHFGNASSKGHTFGQEAHKAVEKSREQISKAINAHEQEIIFTSGSTESINLAIKGLAETSGKRKHFITVKTEHKAVLDCFHWLEAHGYETTYLNVNSDGLINLDELKSAIQPNTILVSVMYSNNEIGVIQPIKEIGSICRQNEIYFMTDATQALGKEPIDVQSMNIDLLALSGHKIYGPKGIGALYVRRSQPRVKLAALIDGGGHERGMRSGTLNVPSIVGFGEAVELAVREMKKNNSHLRELRDYMLEKLQEGIDGLKVNGSLEHRLSNNLNLYIEGIDSDALLVNLHNTVAISTGSACNTTKTEPSHVLTALGLSETDTESCIRIGLGKGNTKAEADLVIQTIIEDVSRLKDLNFDF